jgi:hypothetical protein
MVSEEIMSGVGKKFNDLLVYLPVCEAHAQHTILINIVTNHLPVGTHARFSHRTIVIRIFLLRKGFTLISLALKILEMLGLFRLNSV